MAEIEHFKALKKAFGETTAKTIRDKMPKAFDNTEGLIEFLRKKIPIKSHINKILVENAYVLEVEFLSESHLVERKRTDEPPENLAAKAGYTFHRVETPDQFMAFRTDFPKGSGRDVLCSFNDVPGRLKENFVFWIRRENALSIPRARELTQENITQEWDEYLDKEGRKNQDGTYNLKGITSKREDPFGTSSMCVQINKSNGYIKILNRYNHDLDENKNPDVTFNADLDRIADGLDDAVYKITGIETKKTTGNGFNGNVATGVDGRLYYYGDEKNGVYWGDGFVLIQGIVTLVDPNAQRVVEGNIVSQAGRPVRGYEDSARGIINHETVQKVKFLSKTTIEFTGKNGEKTVIETKDGCMTSLVSNITQVGDKFLQGCKHLTNIVLPSLAVAGKGSFRYNRSLETIALPKLEKIGDNSFRENCSLEILRLPMLEKAGDFSFSGNRSLDTLSLPMLKDAGAYSFRNNDSLKTISIPKLKTVGEYSFHNNDALTTVYVSDTEILQKHAFPGSVSVLRANV